MFVECMVGKVLVRKHSMGGSVALTPELFTVGKLERYALNDPKQSVGCICSKSLDLRLGCSAGREHQEENQGKVLLKQFNQGGFQ